MIRPPFSLLFLFASVCLTLGSTCTRADDLNTVKLRVAGGLLTSVPSASTVNGYTSNLNSNGSWSDIAYGSTANVGWGPLTHLNRLEAMAEGYSSTSSSLYHNTALKADILKAYNYWISSDPHSSNWYYNEISAPQVLGQAMVLINGILTSSQRSSGLTILTRAHEPRSYNSGTNTGQNRVNRATAGIYRGIVANSNSVLDDAFAAIGDTLVITTGDGIQRDGSFHQHGAQLYNSGYGSAFVSSTIDAASLNFATSYAFGTSQQHVLVDSLLDGTQWMIRGQVIDYTASGRDITRKGQSESAAFLSADLTTLLDAVPNYRTEELTAFRARIRDANSSGSADPDLALTGNRQFWQSDLMVQQRPAYYASVKTSSVRTIQPETGNDEGLKNLYLADGVNLILRTGNEYDNIMPVWNWRRLPGTTIEQNSRSLKPAGEFGVAGTATYAGGVSDGKYGATAFKYDRYNVAARKSWFFFDNEFIALGASINAPDSSSNVNTTLNQTLLKGTVSYKSTGGSTQTLALGDSASPDNLQWVFHNGVGYFFPSSVDNATIRAATQSGTWSSINERYDNTSVSANVFTLYLNHGNGFAGGSYNYIVVPGLTVGQMDGYLAANPIQTLSNTGTVQAVRQTTLDTTLAAFYSAASLNLGSGQSFAVSDPAIVIMQRSSNTLKYTASSPTANSPLLAINLNRVKFYLAGASWLDGLSNNATLELGLPTGTRAGDSVGIAIIASGSANPVIQFTTYDQPTTFKYTSDAALVLPGNTRLHAGDNKSLTFKSVISGNFSLGKSGASDLFLSGANTYTAGTVVLGGTVTVSGDQRAADGGWSIGPSNDDATTTTFKSGSKIKVAVGNEFRIGADSATGSTRQLVVVDGTVTNLGSLYLGRYAALNVTGDWTQSGDARISGQGNVDYSPVLTVGNGGTFTYAGTSSFRINPSVSSSANASLIIGTDDGAGMFTTGRGFERTVATGDGTSIVTLASGGTLALSADVPALTTGTFRFMIGDGGGIIDTRGFDTTLATPIWNLGLSSMGLTKKGSGTLELTGAGLYRGKTTVSAGRLLAENSSGSATGTGGVSIASLGTLGGTGFIVPNTGSQSTNTVAIAGKLAPGKNSAGTLTLGSYVNNATVTFASSAIYAFELKTAGNGTLGGPAPLGSSSPALPQTNHDVLRIYGSLDFAAGTQITIASLEQTVLDPNSGYSWRIATATDGITGTPTLGSISGSDFTLYDALPGHSYSIIWTGNDLYLNATPVPEPAMLLFGIGFIVLFRRPLIIHRNA